jgi:predicted transcriptional regulator
MTHEKTTIYLDGGDHRRLKALAAAQGRPTAELIREAVAEYVKRHSPGTAAGSVGAGRSGDPRIWSRGEETLLEGFGEG